MFCGKTENNSIINIHKCTLQLIYEMEDAMIYEIEDEAF